MNTTTQTPDLPVEVRDRFVALQGKLWKRGGVPVRPNLGGREIYPILSNGQLTAEEYQFVNESIASYKLITRLRSGECGFGFQVDVLAHPEIGEGIPQPLVCFESKQVPNEAITSPNGTIGGARKRAVWDLFEPIVQSDENQAFLRYYGLRSDTWEQCEY